MRKLHVALCALLVAAVLAGCNRGPRIDASSPETLRTSTDAIRASLPVEDQQQFDRDLMVVIATALDPSELIDQVQSNTLTKQSIFNKLAPVLDEMTREKLAEKAAKDKAELTRKVDEWDTQRKQLAERQAAYDAVSQTFTAITALDATLEPVQSPVTLIANDRLNVLIVRMHLQNGLNVPIERIKLFVDLAPQGVKNPWVRQAVEKEFAQPVPPGGVMEIASPAMNVEVPENYTGSLEMAAEVEVSQVVAAGGTPTITLPNWTAADALTLAKLDIATEEIRKLELL